MTLAAPETAAREAHIIEFCLAGENYGMDIAAIQEIIRLREITPLPRITPDVEGVINLRGKIVPVLNLRRRLGLPNEDPHSRARIIVVAFQEETIGLIVDSVNGVLRIPESDLEAPSELVCSLDTDFVREVAKVEDRLIIFLHLENVLRLAA